MMELTKHEERQLVELWNRYSEVLKRVASLSVESAEAQLGRASNEFESMRQQIEYVAKKEAIVEFLKVLSKHYA